MAVNLRTFKDLKNNVYSVLLKFDTFPDQDLELMSDFGEPEVDVGGSFTGPPAFSNLATQLRKLKSGFPFTQTFDATGDAQAKDKANVWQSEMITRITAVMATLRGNTDDFSGESLNSI